MFERLGEIVTSGEKYASEADLPEVMLWFPVDKNYVGPALLNETDEQKIDRLLKLARKVRSQLPRITSGLDATGEERLLEYLELREVSIELKSLLDECKPDSSENYDKAKRTVTEINTAIQGLEFQALAEEILKENNFTVGVNKILVPWLDDLQKEAFKNQDKAEDFDKAREIEAKTVAFAKEVRKANKFISQLETDAETQQNKLFSKGLIEDQKTRFKHIALSAANKVEQNRAIVLNWGFYLEMKAESDKLADELLSIYPEVKEVTSDSSEDLHYTEALPLVLSKFLSCIEHIASHPCKPSCMEDGKSNNERLMSSKEMGYKGMKVLIKVGECTEKTPAHSTVWDQQCRLKKANATIDTLVQNSNKLMDKWNRMLISQQQDHLDFQPLLSFMDFYVKCFA